MFSCPRSRSNTVPIQFLNCFFNLPIRLSCQQLRYWFLQYGYLFVRQYLEITCSFQKDNPKRLQIPTALHHYQPKPVPDLKMEDSMCQHSELGTIQSSPINLFLTVRINLIWYFRRTYWTSQTDIQWQVSNHAGKGWTCFWLIQRLIATRVRKADALFFCLPTALET